MKILIAILITIFLLITNGCTKKEETPEKYTISQTMNYQPAKPEYLANFFSVSGDTIIRKVISETPASYTVSTRLQHGLGDSWRFDGELFSNSLFASDIKVTNFDSLCIIKTNEFNKANEIKQNLLKFEDCK